MSTRWRTKMRPYGDLRTKAVRGIGRKKHGNRYIDRKRNGQDGKVERFVF